MNKADALQIFLSIVGSGALFSFLQFLIQRKDTKEDENKEID
jgi:preprotein translocase subunit YajC